MTSEIKVGDVIILELDYLDLHKGEPMIAFDGPYGIVMRPLLAPGMYSKTGYFWGPGYGLPWTHLALDKGAV